MLQAQAIQQQQQQQQQMMPLLPMLHQQTAMQGGQPLQMMRHAQQQPQVQHLQQRMITPQQNQHRNESPESRFKKPGLPPFQGSKHKTNPNRSTPFILSEPRLTTNESRRQKSTICRKDVSLCNRRVLQCLVTAFSQAQVSSKACQLLLTVCLMTQQQILHGKMSRLLVLRETLVVILRNLRPTQASSVT